MSENGSKTRLTPATMIAASTTITVMPLGACTSAPVTWSRCRRIAPAATSRVTTAARPAPITPTGSAGQSASSAPFSAAPAASTPIGAAPTTAPQVGMIGGKTTPRMSPAAMASPSPWQMARNMVGAGGYRATARRQFRFTCLDHRPPHCPP